MMQRWRRCCLCPQPEVASSGSAHQSAHDGGCSTMLCACWTLRHLTWIQISRLNNGHGHALIIETPSMERWCRSVGNLCISYKKKRRKSLRHLHFLSILIRIPSYSNIVICKLHKYKFSEGEGVFAFGGKCYPERPVEGRACVRWKINVNVADNTDSITYQFFKVYLASFLFCTFKLFGFFCLFCFSWSFSNVLAAANN